MAAQFDFVGHTLGHYRIMEQIGAGGMGVVYRTYDEQLERVVAVKVLPAGTLADETARKRFRKEALALARLNHPNIETVHDFGDYDGTDFLVMELIPGSSLKAKLASGPLPEKEIIRLGMQLAEGLAAAHEQEVVHRDLKPGNLMVTPDGRLKILDFGLAKLLHPDQDVDVTQSISAGTGPVSGTLPYMSPEQLRGEPTDARTDIYAAGAVLYEMATGQRPFPQAHGPTLMGAILHEVPPPPSSLNHRIPTALESVILKALDKEPARRYQSARELLVALEGAGSGQAARVARSRWPIIATAGVALLLVGLLLGLNIGGLRQRLLRRTPPGINNATVSSAPFKARRSVAVLGFKNLSGRQDEAWLSTALLEMLTTELAAGEQLRTIPGEDVAHMRIDLSLQDAESYGKETLNRVGTNLGAQDVVVGSYLALGNGQVRTDLRLQDAAAGETLASVTESGSEAELSDLVARVGAELREKLNAGAVSAQDAGAVRAALPSSAEAAQLYSEGLAKMRLFDALKARELLEKAVAAEPEFPLAHSALAASWSILGYDTKAGEEAKKAFDLSAHLSREERLLIEGRYREASKDWDKAVEIYRTLFAFFPDNLDYGLRLAIDLDSAGKSKEALETIEAMRKLPAPARDDPRIDLTEAIAAGSLTENQRAHTAAARAVQKAQLAGARLLMARAWLADCWTEHHLGELKQAVAACQHASDIYGQAGDRNNMAWALNDIATVATDQGDYAAAKKTFEEVLAIFRQIGSKTYTAGALGNLANILQYQGSLAASRKMHEESLALYREVGSASDAAIEMTNIASILLPEGSPDGARKMSEQALASARAIGDKGTMALALLDLGSALYAQGDLPGAKASYDQGLALAREGGDKHDASFLLAGLGQVLTAQADLAAAQKKNEEELAIRSELGEKVAMAEAHLELANLSLESGQAAAAEKLAQQAVVELGDQKAVDDETSCQVLLARAFLAQGKLPEAQKAVDRAQTISKGTENRETHFSVTTTAARVQAASGQGPNQAQAIGMLRTVVDEAAKSRMLPDELEARLALGEIEMKSGKAAAGRDHLATLEKDATAKGFVLIAHKASAAARP